MPRNAVIFDLDGTLIDSLRDIADAANHAMDELGQPRHPVDAYGAMVGDGADVLMQRALPDDAQHLAPRALERFKARYAEHMLDHTALYAGIEPLLSELEGRGVPMAVLSNKPDEAARSLVDRIAPGHAWAAVAGHRAGVPKKPDPTGALQIARQIGVAPPACLFVGDSHVDMRTATAAGMQPIGVSWGWRSRAELADNGAHAIIDRPEQLLRLL